MPQSHSTRSEASWHGNFQPWWYIQLLYHRRVNRTLKHVMAKIERTQNRNFANKKTCKMSSLVRSQWDLCPDKEENAVPWGPQGENFLLEMKCHRLRLNRKVLWDFLVLPCITGHRKALWGLWDLACYKLSQVWSSVFWFCCFLQNDQELRFLL